MLAPSCSPAQTVNLVDRVIDAGEALMRPGVDEDMGGNAQPVQAVRLIPVQYAGADHVLGDVTVGPADQFLDEGTLRVIAGGKAPVTFNPLSLSSRRLYTLP